MQEVDVCGSHHVTCDRFKANFRGLSLDLRLAASLLAIPTHYTAWQIIGSLRYGKHSQLSGCRLATFFDICAFVRSSSNPTLNYPRTLTGLPNISITCLSNEEARLCSRHLDVQSISRGLTKVVQLVPQVSLRCETGPSAQTPTVTFPPSTGLLVKTRYSRWDQATGRVLSIWND